MKNFKHIVLDYNQLFILKSDILEFCETLVNFLITEYLPTLISMEVLTTTNCTEENLTLTSRVIACIETEVSCNILKREFFCEGCAENRPSQTHHICMNMRNLQKFQQIGRHVLMCVNFDSILKNFKQQTSVITQDFVTQFNVDFIVDVLFKTPEDL